jgi:hypothetical protein
LSSKQQLLEAPAGYLKKDYRRWGLSPRPENLHLKWSEEYS